MGLTVMVAASIGFSPSLFSTFMTFSDGICRFVRHVPSPVRLGITQSPFVNPFALDPAETTSKTPSLPGTAEGWEVPRSVFKDGKEAYVPWI